MLPSCYQTAAKRKLPLAPYHLGDTNRLILSPQSLIWGQFHVSFYVCFHYVHMSKKSGRGFWTPTARLSTCAPFMNATKKDANDASEVLLAKRPDIEVTFILISGFLEMPDIRKCGHPEIRIKF